MAVITISKQDAISRRLRCCGTMADMLRASLDSINSSSRANMDEDDEPDEDEA